MRISLIAAVAENGVIGRGNALPWRLPADLRRFKALTMGKPVVMGRKTHESIGRPLPGRTNIVMTRRREALPGCVTACSVEDAMRAAGDAAELMVIGGEEIYRRWIGLADRIYLTRVEASMDGDARFPEIDPSEWRETLVEAHQADAATPVGHRFVILDRGEKPPAP